MECPMTALAFQLTASRLGALKLYALLMANAMFNPRFVSYASQACEFSLRTWKAETEISAAGKGPIQIMRAVREWIGRLRGNLATSGLRADASGAQRGRTDGTARCVPFHFISQSLRDTSNRWGSGGGSWCRFESHGAISSWLSKFFDDYNLLSMATIQHFFEISLTSAQRTTR
ncbi:hypothetical protein OPV22_029583 [Ensete ventricosum]|uniref:Uncharacterized protein n=1 Tax=Ensete ventricosum TaxID=4639 RepID=A0AAV8QBR0_ENSVE|nr:hypothetical protein OPV22_029583 [Ensete ventricosum]